MKLHGSNEAEYALLISDQWQGQGIEPSCCAG